MRRGFGWLLAYGTAGVLTAGTVHAQRPHRSGLWFEGGAGIASIRVACTGCEDLTRAAGSGVAFRIGGVISNRVLFGLETFSFVDENFGLGDDDESIVAATSNLGGIALWYPWRGGFFLKGGIGLARGEFTVDPRTEAEQVIRGTGVGLTFGVGFDLPVKRWLAISLNAGAYVTAIGDLVLPTVRVDDVIPSMYALTLGFTLR
jgi:hypothetical protein